MSQFNELEFLKVLDAAKKSGARSIEIQGFRVVFDQEIEAKRGAPPPENNPQNNSQGVDFCRKHNENYVDGRFGPYCTLCSAERKEKRWRQRQDR